MLPNKGHLSGLLCRLETNTYAQLYANDDKWPVQVCDIRLVGNGNKEIIDLRGRQAAAINFWETNKMPPDVLIDAWHAEMYQTIYLPFGRFLGDMKYGLILDRFKTGVQFEDTNTISTSVFRDGYTNYSIYGLFRKNPEPGCFEGGYFKKRQVLNRDTTTATQHSETMPTTNLLKQIHMFIESDWSTHAMTTALRSALTKIWLGIKSQEEYIVDNMDWRTFYQMMHHKYGRKPKTILTHDVHVSTASYVDTMIYDREITLRSPLDVFTIGAQIPVEYKWDREERVLTYRQYTHDNSRQAGYIMCHNIGTCYNGNVPLLDIDPMAEEDKYLDSDELGDITVEFTEAANTENVYIVLDELQKTYPD